METNFVEHKESKNTELFFNLILENLKNTNFEDLFSKLEEKINLSNEGKYSFEKLNEETYIKLGSIAYMYGIGFINQGNNLTYLVMKNLKERFDLFNFNLTKITRFENILKSIPVEVIEKSNEIIKNKILENINFDNINLNNIKTNLNSILRNSIFEVGYSKTVQEFLDKKTITYGDLLMVIRFIFENCQLKGELFLKLNEIQKNTEFIKAIDNAEKIYENQKYSILYFDSILSLKEYLTNTEITIDYKSYLTDESIETLKIEINTDLKENSDIDNLKSNSEEAVEVSRISDDLPDYFLKELLEETFNKKIETISDLAAAISTIVENEEIMVKVYHYINHHKKSTKIDFKEVYNFDSYLLNDYLNENITSLNTNYKESIEKYLAEIPDTKLSIIRNLVKTVIKSLIISNAERKSYLYSELLNSDIKTYKHLHQILDLIEQSSVTGKDMIPYINLSELLNNDKEIENIFNSTFELDLIQEKLKYFNAFKNFFFFRKDIEEPKQ